MALLDSSLAGTKAENDLYLVLVKKYPELYKMLDYNSWADVMKEQWTKEPTNISYADWLPSKGKNWFISEYMGGSSSGSSAGNTVKNVLSGVNTFFEKMGTGAGIGTSGSSGTNKGGLNKDALKPKGTNWWLIGGVSVAVIATVVGVIAVVRHKNKVQPSAAPVTPVKKIKS